MTDDEVVRNLTGMDELDFNGWNNADWNGVFAQHHTDEVVVYGKGQPPTHGIQEHIDAAKGPAGVHRRQGPADHVAPDQGSGPENGLAWSGRWKATAGW